MNAVVTQGEVSVVLKSRELRRQLIVERSKYGHLSLSLRTLNNGRRSLAYGGGLCRDWYMVEFMSPASIAGELSLIVDSLQFPISRAEADRLAAELGIEVRKQ